MSEKQVLREIFGDAEVYTESEGGPDGPWHYESLTVRRNHNTISVRDVDGVLHTLIEVDELPNGDEAYDALESELDVAHESE